MRRQDDQEEVEDSNNSTQVEPEQEPDLDQDVHDMVPHPAASSSSLNHEVFLPLDDAGEEECAGNIENEDDGEEEELIKQAYPTVGEYKEKCARLGAAQPAVSQQILEGQPRSAPYTGALARLSVPLEKQ